MGHLSIIEELSQIVKNGEKEAKEILDRPFNTTMEKEKIIPKSSMGRNTYENKFINQFYQGDNLIVIEKLLKEGL